MDHALPKAVRTAINRNAFKIAMTAGYQSLRIELEERARSLMRSPHATVADVIATLDRDRRGIVQTPGQDESCGHAKP